MMDVAHSTFFSSNEMESIQVDNQLTGIHEQSQIQSMFHGEKVLVTGATGFVGKVLIESLLRKTSIEKIYVLIRPKRNKSTKERMEDLLNDKVFQKLKSETPKRMDAIILVSGDCLLPELGLNSNDKETLLNGVNIVFHVAAMVRFNENLKVATGVNVTATRMLLDIARKMKNLKVIMYVSTAFSNAQSGEILEKIYPVKEEINMIQLANSIDYETALKITKAVIGDSPNTYIFTKRVTEDMIQRKYSDLPIGIFRPAIVIGAKEEPLPGYVDNLYGPTGLAIGIMSGVVHCLLIRKDATADIVPVDYVVNCLIASSWQTYTRFVNDHLYNNIPVYNFVPYTNSSITWGKFADQIVENSRKAASANAVWYPFIFRVKSILLYKIISYIFHFIPAWVGDAIMKFLGKKTRWSLIYKRTDDLMTVVRPFCTRDWRFSNESVHNLWRILNEKDKKLFPFCLENFNWRKYLETYLQGVRIYLIKEKNEGKAAEKRSKRLYLIHCAFVLSLVSFLSGIIYLIRNFSLKFIQNV